MESGVQINKRVNAFGQQALVVRTVCAPYLSQCGVVKGWLVGRTLQRTCN